VKICRVSYTDIDGFGHSVDVPADSLYEAVGLAIARFKRDAHIEFEPAGLVDFTVEPRDPTASHKVTRRKFDEWLSRNGGKPQEVARRGRVREALGIAPP
jgi:hypothetical protein